MAKHTPNIVPIKIRIALSLFAAFLLVFALAALATGLTYIPGKRGGFLLSGIPTLMIVLSASTLCIASLLTIIDHYDTRPNEASYKIIKNIFLIISFTLFFSAPLMELIERLSRLSGSDVFPEFHGIAENYTFFSPKLIHFAHYLDPILNNGASIAALAFVSCGIGLFVNKFFPNRAKRPAMLFISIGMLCLSFLCLTISINDFFTGEVNVGARHYKYVVRAESEPAKFNAILLSDFALGGFMFTASAFVFIGIATNRIKPS